MPQDREKLAYISALIYSIIIGLSFLFVKTALSVTDPIHVLAHRYTVAFILVALPLSLGFYRISFSLYDIIRLIPLSLFYPTSFFLLQTFGLAYTTSSEAGIIQAALPIFTTILAFFILGEATSKRQNIGIVMSILGLVFIFTMTGVDFSSSSAFGNLLILLSALAFSFYAVYARKTMRNFPPFDLTLVLTIISFVVYNYLSFIKHLIDKDLITHFEPFTDLSFVLAIIYLGGLSTLLTSFLSNYTLSRIPASKMSIFTNLATLITILAGIVFLQESLYYYHIIGAILIIAGVITTNMATSKNTQGT